MTEPMPWVAILLIAGALVAVVGLIWLLKAATLKATDEGAGRVPTPTRGQTEGVDRDPTHGVSAIEDPNPHGYNDEPRDHQAR